MSLEMNKGVNSGHFAIVNGIALSSTFHPTTFNIGTPPFIDAGGQPTVIVSDSPGARVK
jgi:hypothetical protein